MAATFVLIIVGGIVTTLGAGLSVPDWPLTYGQMMPEFWYKIRNIAAEHSHRMIAGAVGLLTLGLAVCVSIFERRRWVRRLAWIALGTVVVQALWGGATVLILGHVRPYIRVFHAVLAQTFFALIITLAMVLSRWWREAGPQRPAPRAFSIRSVCLITTALLFVQLLLGAAMRHTESGLALTEFPRSQADSWLPPTDAAGLKALNDARDETHELEAVTLAQVWSNFAHRAFSLVAAFGVVAIAMYVVRFHAAEPELLTPAVGLLILLAAQLILGIMTVLSLKHAVVTTMHVGVGVLMFAVAFNLTLRAYRLFGPAQAVEPAASRALEVAAS